MKGVLYKLHAINDQEKITDEIIKEFDSERLNLLFSGYCEFLVISLDDAMSEDFINKITGDILWRKHQIGIHKKQYFISSIKGK